MPSALVSDKEANRRLLREARAAATLDHPNICAIHEISEADGRNFIVMQYIDGETLAEKIKREGLSVHEVVNIAIDICMTMKSRPSASEIS